MSGNIIFNRNNKAKTAVFSAAAVFISALIITAAFLLEHKAQTPGAASGPFVLSEEKFELNNESMTIKLVMTKGRHITDGEPGPYGEDYHEGNLIGEIYDNRNKLISSADLGKYYEENVIFRDKFKLLFDDYNGDGLVDFTVGQYVSSNCNAFIIFTVNSSGEIIQLPVKNNPGGIWCSKFDEYYSTRFAKTGSDGIIVSLYDMEKGEYIEKTYHWDGNEFAEAA